MGFKSKYIFDEEQLRKLVLKHTSIAGVLRELNYKLNYPAYKQFHKKTKEFNIDYSHFSTRENYVFKTKESIKKSLIRNGTLAYLCSECEIKEWQGKPISLELHHIDGNGKNNELSNLCLLCPNCHSQTDNWKGKKNSKKNL